MIERIIKAIEKCNKTNVEITAQTNLRDDLKFDSLGTIMLINELESEFDIEIDEDDFSDVRLVSDIAEKLKKRLNEGS